MTQTRAGSVTQRIADREERLRHIVEDFSSPNVIQSIPPDRRDYLHWYYRAEDPLKLTFDASQIPMPNDFVQKVDRVYEQEVRMGAVPIPPLDPSRQGKSHLPQTPVFMGTAAPKRAVRYSWLPMSEIHTARTRIDSFVHLLPSQRKKLHEEFASMVSCLISQFGNIGDLDDESITADQATVLTQAFSDALIEIQKTLFRPIERQHILNRRGPVQRVRPKTSLEDRRLRRGNTQTLSDIVGTVRKRASQIQKKVPVYVTDDGEEKQAETTVSIFPPQYQVQPTGDFVRPQPEHYALLSGRIRKEMEEAEKQNVANRKVHRREPARHVPEIITTPRARPQATPAEPAPRKKNPPKCPTFQQVCHKENEYFDAGGFELEPIAGVETAGCLDGINRLFAPAPVEAPPEEAPAPPVPLQMPKFDQPRAKQGSSDYLFSVSPASIEPLLDDSILMIVDEEKAEQEQKNLQMLWDQLGLSPEMRLRMATRLCSIVTENVESDYHFQAIMVAATDFQTYDHWYKLYKNTLNYEPSVSAPEKAHAIAEIATNFKVAETAFQRANLELIQILGTEVLTAKGSITQLIQKRAAKIAIWKQMSKLDQGDTVTSVRA
jgi:hypothetical protein